LVLCRKIQTLAVKGLAGGLVVF